MKLRVLTQPSTVLQPVIGVTPNSDACVLQRLAKGVNLLATNSFRASEPRHTQASPLRHSLRRYNMNLQLRTVLRFCGICVSVLGICGFLWPQSSPAPGGAADNPVTAFVFVQRTKAHVNYSKSEVFHSVVDDVYSYLAAKDVALAKDEFGGRTHAEDEMPISTVLNIARDANATYVLYLIVDRPITKLIKVTVRCYDLSGKQLWEESAADSGGLTGIHRLPVILDRLHQLLDKRLGQPGLPLMMAAKESSQQAPADQK